MMREPRQHDEDYLDFIRGLPCVLCGDNTSVEAAHIRYGDPVVCKRKAGMGEKPDDVWTLPLCGRHHREQHGMNEKYFWEKRGIDPVKVSLALQLSRGDQERAERITEATQAAVTGALHSS